LFSQGGLNLTLLEIRQKTTLINNLVAKLSSPITRKYIIQDLKSIQRSEAIWHCPVCNPEEFGQDNWILYAATSAKEF
jgi:hypothetical protein